MAVFKYRAKKGSEGIVEGRIEARNEKEAVEKLGQIGCLPIRIEQEGKPAAIPPSRAQAKIKSHHITLFSRELSSLLKAGVPILKAIDIISEQSEDPRLKNVLRSIYNAIRDGDAFSSILSQYPNIFSPLYVAMIRAGENSGALAEALLRIADYRMKQEEIISRFRMASVYPALTARLQPRPHRAPASRTCATPLCRNWRIFEGSPALRGTPSCAGRALYLEPVSRRRVSSALSPRSCRPHPRLLHPRAYPPLIFRSSFYRKGYCSFSVLTRVPLDKAFRCSVVGIVEAKDAED